jgi:hypothetical protein
MLVTRSRRAGACLIAGSIVLTLVVGCSGNQNEAEFLKSAPPGTPSEFPNESFGERRARTLGPSHPVKGVGAKKSTGGTAP